MLGSASIASHDLEPAEPDSTNFGFIVLITLTATISGFLFGYDSGVVNGTFAGLQKAFGSTTAGTGFNVGAILLGSAVGAFMAGWLADKLGRKTILVISSVCFAVTAYGAGAAGSSLTFVVARLIGGLAVGAASVLAPTYISEVAPAKYRGRLSSIQQVAIIGGLTASATSNYMIARWAGGATAIWVGGIEAWRWMFWAMVLPSVTFLISVLFIPESPRYLVACGRKDRARVVLERLFGAAAESKLEAIDASLATHRHRPRLADILASKTVLRPIVWVGIGLASFQQLSGINAVYYYSALLWQSAGFSEVLALLFGVIVGVIGLIGALVATTLIDRVGRKPLLVFGSIGMALALACLTVIFATAAGQGGVLQLTRQAGIAAVACQCAYVFIFNLSWGPVMWVMLGEMFPNQLRGSGMAVSGLAQWTTNFAVTISLPVLLATAGLGVTYTLYTGFAVIALVFVIKAVHETTGKELEEMKG